MYKEARDISVISYIRSLFIGIMVILVICTISGIGAYILTTLFLPDEKLILFIESNEIVTFVYESIYSNIKYFGSAWLFFVSLYYGFYGLVDKKQNLK